MYRNVTQLYFCMFFSPAFTDHDRPNYILSIPFSSLVMRWVGCRICMKFFNVWIACFVQTLTKGQSDELNITPPPEQVYSNTTLLRCALYLKNGNTTNQRLDVQRPSAPTDCFKSSVSQRKGETTQTPPPLPSSETNHWCSNSFWRDSFLGKWWILQMFSGSLLCRWGQVMVL